MHSRLSSFKLPNKKIKSKDDSDDDDIPIKFSTSKASKLSAEATRRGYEASRLWYEPYVVIASLSIFLIYFCILREENDIDVELGRNLYSRIDGLEEQQLRLCLKYNLEHNLDVTDIVKRLREIEAEKNVAAE